MFRSCLAVARVGVEMTLMQLEGRDLEYSPQSGIRTRVYLGREPSMHYLGLDFASSDSFLHTVGTCPPFIGECFHTMNLVPADQPSNIGALLGTFTTLRIGNIDFPNTHFELQGTVMDNPAFRDVHGAIGAGPASDVFCGRLMQITETVRDHPWIHEVISTDGMIAAEVSSSVHWRVEDISFEIFGLQLADSMSMSVLPPHDDIIFPLRLTDEVVRVAEAAGHRILIEEDRLFVDTERPVKLNFMIRKANQYKLVIAEDQLVGTTITDGLIDTRIHFSRDATSVIIGRALVRSLDRIVLDYQEAKVWFGQNVDRKRRFVSPPFRIPLFDEPMILGDRTVAANRLPSLTDNAYTLLTERRVPVEFSRERYGCWTFLKVYDDDVDLHANVSGAFVTEGVGTVKMVYSPRQGGAASFKFAGLKLVRSSVFIEKNGRVVNVCVREEGITRRNRRMNRRVADLPLPEETKYDGTNPLECPVCLDRISADQPSIKLRACNHVFHAHCIRSWVVDRNKLNCPMCRSPVHTREEVVTPEPVECSCVVS